jgi:L-ascorbate metabolism protein UlaG (beta-lactamase superfamily)
LYWLGQAGFLIDTPKARIVTDPYLSDTLAEKYRGAHFPHTRLMPPPVAPEELEGVSLLLCTHGHTDHLDHGTIPGLERANPRMRVVTPASVREKALERGVEKQRLETIEAGEETETVEGVRVRAVPAAHEERSLDEEGRHLFLGYLISAGGLTIYHSGDTVPFSDLTSVVRAFEPDVCLLPVNGRDEERRSHGVAGNFTLEEACEFTFQVGASYMIGHHFGMFGFNTIDPEVGRKTIAQLYPDRTDRLLLARMNTEYRLTRV